MFRSPIVDAVVVIIVLLLFFGPKRLPMLSRSVGESIKEFKGGISRDDQDEKSKLDAVPTSAAAPTSATESTDKTRQHTA
jgi:sec-independent protein translocase protein TatA